MDGGDLLVSAAAAHLGFQWLVHVVVYPGLADQAGADAERGAALHERYTRRMAVAVAPVYALLALAVVVGLVLEPGAWAVVAAVLAAATVAVTAGAAVPLHRALSRPGAGGATAQRHRRLLAVDRVRLVLAAALAAVAVVGALGP